MADYSNDQVKGFADYTLGNGGSWADITNAASQYGVPMSQVYGAGVKQPGVPDWMNSLNSQIASDPTQTSWKDPTSGLTYMTRDNSGWDDGQGKYSVGQYKPNGQYNIYDSMGKDTGKTGQYGNPNADNAYLIAMAAMAAGGLAAGGGFGGGGAAGAGGGFTAGEAPLEGMMGTAGGATTGGVGAGSIIAGEAPLEGAAGTAGAGAGATGTLGTIPPLATDLGTIPPAMTVGGGLTAGEIASGAGAASTAGKIISGAGGGGSGNGPSLSDIIHLIQGGVDNKNQNQASNDMLTYLRGQQDKIDKLYSPGSPEYNYLSQQLDRKDAAAGRMSQYGPRSTDLAARIAQIKADETVRMTTGIGNLYKGALNQKASAPTGLLSSLDSLSKGLGYSVSDITQWLRNNGLSKMYDSGGNYVPDTSTTSNADNYQPDGGDLGQYL